MDAMNILEPTYYQTITDLHRLFVLQPVSLPDGWMAGWSGPVVPFVSPIAIGWPSSLLIQGPENKSTLTVPNKNESANCWRGCERMQTCVLILVCD